MTKSIDRRKFLQKGGIAALGFTALGTSILSCANENKTTEIKPLKILILGGTSFLGPHMIAYALERGHSISTFTRGKSKPSIYQELFEKVESLIGDRKDNLEALKNKKWDVVIDNSCHDVEWAKSTAKLLKGNVAHYIFTSSTGVYYPYLGDNIDEKTEILNEEPEVIEVEEEKLEYWYAVMKGNAEKAVIKEFGEENSLAIRPTYMIGPADKSDRFIHWPVRFSQGGEILVPGKKDDPVQYMDVRDVAEFTIRMAEQKASGAYNCAGPAEKQGMHDFVMEAAKLFDKEKEFVFIDDYKFLKENNVPYLVPWIMPEGKNHGSSRVNNNKAKAAGLSFRNLSQTTLDTYNWWVSNALSDERRAKFTDNPKQVISFEKEVIKKWKELKSNGSK